MFPLHIFLLLLPQNGVGADPVVHINSGDIKGKIQTSRDGKEFAAFEGVPYGEKPVRWLPPEPKKNWTNVLDCTSTREICLQVIFYYSEENKI